MPLSPQSSPSFRNGSKISYSSSRPRKNAQICAGPSHLVRPRVAGELRVIVIPSSAASDGPRLRRITSCASSEEGDAGGARPPCRGSRFATKSGRKFRAVMRVAKCHKRPLARLIRSPRRGGKQHRRNFETERLGRLEVEHEFVFCRLPEWKIGWPVSLFVRPYMMA